MSEQHYYVGSTVTVSDTIISNANGQPVDGLGSIIIVRGSRLSSDVVTVAGDDARIRHPALGHYEIDWTLDMPGTWTFIFTGTAAAGGKAQTRIVVDQADDETL